MTVDNKSFAGGPGIFGYDMEVPNHVYEWIHSTPANSDPREFMTEEEKEHFDKMIEPIGELTIDEQEIYFGLIRGGASLESVKEIASYDRIV